MKDIDFLPIRYHERSALRRSRVRRGIILSCLAAFVVVVALAQVAMRRPVEQQLKTVNSRYPAAVAATALADQLQQDVSEMNELATVTTYLQHPWPTTQLLASLTRSLPDSIVIHEITIDRQPTGAAPFRLDGDQAAAQELGLAAAARRDLDRLRGTVDAATSAIHVTGVTEDVAALHRYVRGLAPSSLFTSAKVESLVSVTSENRLANSRFELRLLIRPGFGQPGGPETPLLPQTSLASRNHAAEAQP